MFFIKLVFYQSLRASLKQDHENQKKKKDTQQRQQHLKADVTKHVQKKQKILRSFELASRRRKRLRRISWPPATRES